MNAEKHLAPGRVLQLLEFENILMGFAKSRRLDGLINTLKP